MPLEECVNGGYALKSVAVADMKGLLGFSALRFHDYINA